MPTPVSVARQCLTPEAAHAMDEAVAVARRRGHAQTTSLHAVSALLSLPLSTLRDACARARNCAYSPRLQFKALELCLSVSLDRITSSSQQTEDEPPVSNSLMAAIKRSQANQRRQPENFHLYHHQLPQSPNSSVTIIKVELQHLIVSILDDPVVSRVFSESGFRSSEIKLAILRPLASQLFKYSRSKAPPSIFLCNYLNESFDPGSGRRRLSSSFPGFGGFLDNEDENSRRISDVLLQKRNPLLVGVQAYAALKIFCGNVEKNKNNKISDNNNNNNNNGLGLGLGSGCSVQLSGLEIISIENEVLKFVSGDSDNGSVNKKFEEVGLLIERNLGPGVVVNFGDLKVFVNNNNNSNNNNNNNNNVDDDDDDDDVNNDGGNRENGDAVSHVVAQLTRLLQLYGGKVWLIGAAATYETYLKFVSRFSSIEKDWDLQILPITSLRPSSMTDSCHRSSLMESFVPFGGFFSTPSDFKNPLNQSVTRCHLCNEKCEQEIAAASKGGFTASIADQCQSILPSWLQMAGPDSNKGLDLKIKDDGLALRSKITKKWDDVCQSLHQTQPLPSSNTYQVGSKFSNVVDFQFLQDKKKNADNSSSNTNPPDNGDSCINEYSGIPIDSENVSASRSAFPIHPDSKTKNDSLLTKQWEKPSKLNLDSGCHRSPCSLSNSSVDEGSRKYSTPGTSVTTDLGLGIGSAPTTNEPKEPTYKDHAEISQELSGCGSAAVDFVNGSISNQPAQSSSSSCPDLNRQFELSNWKTLFRALTERIGWQDEAISIISQRIAHHRTGNEDHHGMSPRGDIWFNFAGPDRRGKMKIAIALAEIIFRCKENFIYVNLCPQDGVLNHQDVSGNSVQFRGKTVADYIAWELYKKPLSVVFLENVDKADVHVQNSLSKAIRTGKFSDSHGREVSIRNAICVTTSSFMKDSEILPSGAKHLNYSEERILRAKSRLMQILIEPTLVNRSINQNLSTSGTSERISHPNKRKLIGRTKNENPQQHDISDTVKRAHTSSTRNLDLNLPAEEEEEDEVVVLDSDDDRNSDSSENTKSWLQDFFNPRVETVSFKPFNFDALSEKIQKDINASFCEIVGSNCLLEIDMKVMEQLLAAAYLSDNNRVIEDWLEKVLVCKFLEVQEKHNLTANSIVKLVAFEGHFLEELTPGVCLPPKIIQN